MTRTAFSFRLALAGLVAALPGTTLLGQAPKAARPLANGIYLVLRQAENPKNVLPVKAGEVVVVHRPEFVKKEDAQPPQHLVLHRSPDVALVLDGKPQGIKEGKRITQIRLRLAKAPAAKLERLTQKNPGKQVAVVLGGKVVSVHKIRTVIKDGKVAITSCTEGGCAYLLQELDKALPRK